MSRRLLLVLAGSLLLAFPLLADEVYLTSGKCLRGTITAEHPDRIEIRLESGETRTVPRSEVALVKKGTSAIGEYRKRLAAVDRTDREALLELAAWCEENRLGRQRVAVLRLVIKVDPDCPTAHAGLGEIWNGSRWARDPKKGDLGVPVPGSKVDASVVRLELRAPRGFTTAPLAEGIRLKGPERYRTPVHVDLLPGSDAATKGFPEANGWSKPEEIAHGKLRGRWSQRVKTEDGRRLAVRETELAGDGAALVVRITALACEVDDWVPHIAHALANARIVAPKLDYVHKGLGIGFRHPKGWSIKAKKWDDDTVFLKLSNGEDDMKDWAGVTYIWLRPDEVEGSVPDDPHDRLVQLAFEDYCEGDVVVKRDVKLGVVPAKLWEVNELEDGTPLKVIYVITFHGGRVHILYLSCLEFSADKFRADLELITGSFTFGVK